jgi:hypothetical protein
MRAFKLILHREGQDPVLLGIVRSMSKAYKIAGSLGRFKGYRVEVVSGWIDETMKDLRETITEGQGVLELGSKTG